MSDAANLDEKNARNAAGAVATPSRRRREDLMAEEPRPIEELTFREAMAELDGIVGVLESNTLELEESLAAYERGVVLLGSLQKRLGAAEQQVEVLMGELVAAPDDETQDTTLS